jgi:hypothetical protein
LGQMIWYEGEAPKGFSALFSLGRRQALAIGFIALLVVLSIWELFAIRV